MRKYWVPAILISLCLVGCMAVGSTEPELVTAIIDRPDDYPPADMPVPIINYPDVYLAYYEFGFNLPPGWAVERREAENTLLFRKENFVLSMRYWAGDIEKDHLTPPASLEPFPYDQVEEAGTVTLDSFWNGYIEVAKYRMVEDGRVALVYYDDQIQIGRKVLIVCLGEQPSEGSSSEGIPAAIEAEADALIGSYEEHGWEE
jgi:hypothetical protein